MRSAGTQQAMVPSTAAGPLGSLRPGGIPWRSSRCRLSARPRRGSIFSGGRCTRSCPAAAQRGSRSRRCCLWRQWPSTHSSDWDGSLRRRWGRSLSVSAAHSRSARGAKRGWRSGDARRIRSGFSGRTRRSSWDSPRVTSLHGGVARAPRSRSVQHRRSLEDDERERAVVAPRGGPGETCGALRSRAGRGGHVSGRVRATPTGSRWVSGR